MARGEVEVTHKALDTFSQDRSAAYLRHILVHTGILPERTEYLEQIGPWFDQLLADQPAADAKIIRAYFLEDDQRWDELDRCLTDDAMSLPARVAGALLFLSGLQPTRLVSLKADDVQEEEGDTYLVVGNGRLPLPPALARLTVELRDHGRIASAIGRTAKERSWLFHGVAAGRPLSESGLRRHLDNAGIHTHGPLTIARSLSWQQTYQPQSWRKHSAST